MLLENKFLLVSVVVPVRNEEKYIRKCIKSLINQDYPRDSYEVIVVDGMSNDNSKKIIQSFVSTSSNIFLIKNPNLFTSFGLNIGIKKSKGDVIIILGSHSFVDSDFIRRNIETIQRVEADCVGGPIKTLGKGKDAKAISLAISSSFGVGDALFRYSQKEGYVDTVAFGGYKRKVFEEIGLFDEELIRNQDDELNYRLRKSGGKIFITPQIKSFYYSQTTLKKLGKQYFRYGFWKVRVLQKHPKMMMFRHFIPLIFVSSAIIVLLLSFYSRIFLYLFLFVLGSHFIGDILFSFEIARKQGWKYFPLLPIIFNVLHWSYGLGFLIGLFRFFNRWFVKESFLPKLVTKSL